MNNLINSNFVEGLFAVFSVFLWALGTVLLKRIGRDFPPILFNIIKSVIVLICFGIPLLIIKTNPITFKTILFLSIAGILTNTFGHTFYISALKNLVPR